MNFGHKGQKTQDSKRIIHMVTVLFELFRKKKVIIGRIQFVGIGLNLKTISITDGA